ncbi:putative bifunctional diguanylate cyclase/phosphodiesterase [Paractinoplanes atraurantiacus]|uniref:PAS domain S-box-containing protein/diguanylate cyclase (GGDEF) domain-containing protein n=1 Tax=Paractinoplanes atraurantiacus TaxID=1036182 RepID=A0A285IC54_9ACTN|nr:EAL domain-containing protein [Actinoplanes atraurantiacus]SNY45559.1 PAS domain S-box-containing protein/diguanylate cyclase (GGDEF) domain-containing protein [Actinoplanes atraurantiacus]
MTTRAARVGFCAWIVALTALYYAFPGGHLYTWALIGYSSAAMVLLGARLNRPEHRLPWYLISAALAFFTTGDTWYNLILALGRTPRFPGLADLFYLLVYPLLTAGFLLFVRYRGTGSNRAALLDSLVPTVGLGLLSWVYWIAPFTRSHDLSLLEKLVSIGYPLGDVLALAMTLRMLAAPGRRPRALTAIGVAIVGLLVSDIFYGQSQLNSDWSLGGPVDFGWIVFYAVMGFTALMPSMRELSREQPPQVSIEMGTRRIVWMAAAALIAPVVLYIEWMHGREIEAARQGVVDAPVIAAAAALMFLLVLARVNGLAGAQRQARARERALRQAGAMLFSAATEQDAARAVRDAVATLMPEDKPYRLSLTADAGDARHVPGLRFITASELPAGVPSHGFDHFLYATTPLPTGRLGAGLLGGDGAVLRELLPSFEAYLAQIEVVMQRIGLTGEVNRRESEAYFRTLIQNATDVILIVGDDDLIRYASPSAGTVLGHPDLEGTPLAALIAVSHHEAMREILGGLRDGQGELDGPDLAVLRADGSLLQVECTGRDLRDDPTVGGVVLTVRDVTERRRLEKDLSHLAFHDGLTGLANRVLFRNRLDEAFAAASESGLTLGVLFVDLDDFKEVNDTLGHAVGDELLVAVGRRIDEIVGTTATAARMGGDEFAVLVAGDPEAVAARLVEALAVPVEVGDGLGGTHIVSGAASVGVATNGDAGSPTELLRHADLALYQAKGSDKGTWQRYRPELHTEMVQRLETRAALYEAIDDDQLRVMYQPIVDLPTGAIVAVEALVRWQHPTRGLLGPYHFIEVAEESGAIVPIGGWVLREALGQLAAWKAAEPEMTLRYVSVNVSARQFRTPGFVDQVRQAITEAGAKPEWLLLEITESLLLRDADQVANDLHTLRALGVRIAIDDFGTGYSSLSYLRQMPVDVLKVDKSFIDDILGSEQQRALVDAIVTLARNLDLAVVAEGIEDAGQRAALVEMDCPYGQGYHFSKPVWPDEIPPLAHDAQTLVASPARG